jgi:anti-sigma B factor antagonist
MSAPALTMEVRRIGETTAVVAIKGEVTAACESALMLAYEAAGGAATSRLVLNFAGLDYMNSGGIGMLVTLLVRANRQRQQLAAYGLSEHYREIFELTRLDEAITIYDSEESALSGVVR